jgi:hypothetical protein
MHYVDVTSRLAMKPYLIELLGGPYDGQLKSTDLVPCEQSFELTGQGLGGGNSSRRGRVHAYQLQETMVRFINGLPVMTFRYQHSGGRS